MKNLPAIILVCLFCSCKKAAVSPTTATSTCDSSISYSKTVNPIFVSNCTASGCHDGVDYPSLADYITAKDAAQQIRTAVKNGVMPKVGILSDADKNSIICWIDNGTRNN